MFASVATAMASFQVVFFREYHIALLVVVEINMFLQRCLHRKAALSGASLSGLPVVQI